MSKTAMLAVQGRGAPPVPAWYALYNGSVAGENTYRIGFAYSKDQSTWTTTGSPAITPSLTWEQTNIAHPALVWDGSQYVCYYAGGGSPWQIGRATAKSPSGTWTKYASNPVLTPGGVGTPDHTGMDGPVVYYDATLSPPWKMWYAGINGSVATTCFADSTDGLSWTKRGKVIDRKSVV